LGKELPKTLKGLASKKYISMLSEPEKDNNIYFADESRTDEIISLSTLDFVKKAGKEFDKDRKKKFYLDESYGERYLAIRCGIYNDCIKVYRLGQRVGIFSGYMLLEPLLVNDKNINEYNTHMENKDLKNKLQFAVTALDNNELYVKQLQNKILVQEEALHWFKEEKRNINYNNWIDGKYISNVTIYEGW
jgi:hypothetical protein